MTRRGAGTRALRVQAVVKPRCDVLRPAARRFYSAMKRFILEEEKLHPMTAHPTRVCFELRVRPELIDDYVARHTPVRAEMLAEIAAAGRRNYSLFLGDQGA